MRVPPQVVRTGVACAAIAAAASAAACINTFWKTEVRAVDARAAAGAPADSVPVLIRSPLKAHLVDGTTVVFRHGAQLHRDRITGAGDAYPLLANASTPRDQVPLDSVVGVETFEGRLLAAQSVVVSTAATAVGALGTIVLLKAIFGSCPTVYADSGTGPLLQAEGFSYAIAPLLEHRDLDALAVRPASDGVVRLELRNEALETHFINHVELLAVRHAEAERVVPDQRGRPVAVSDLRPLAAATDRAGRDVRAVLDARDGALFSSAASVADAAAVGDLHDWIDLDVDDLPAGDSVAVVLRLRNSLLNTVLLYEGMLGGRDAPDWLATGLQHIGRAVEMSQWYVRTMGMHASVDGVPGVEVRMGDVGPLAFRDVAIVLPRPARDARRVRVRLRFVADNWRIDHVAVAGRVARPEVRTLALSRVVVPTPQHGVGPRDDGAALGAMGEADDRYLETRPGQRMRLEFAPAPSGSAGAQTTTYLIAWQGWYREWIRGAWLAAPTRDAPFVPGDAAVLTALERWRARQGELERAFYATQVPVR